MPLTESATMGDLLAEITRLEDQISKLSSQLDSNHETIGLLKQTLAERESRILELESNLVFTPKLLLQNALNKIHACKIQLKDGVDEKIINPVLAQIRQQIDLILHLMAETKIFINQSKQIVHQNIDAILAVVNKSPEQARLYFEKTIIEPILSLVHQAVETIKKEIQTTHRFIRQKIISPSKSIYAQGIEAVLALPSQSQIIFQMWAVEPALRTLHEISDFGHSLSNDSASALTNLLIRIKNLINQGLTFITEQVKQSPFWDGKRNIEAMA